MFTGIIESLSETIQAPTRAMPILETQINAEVWPELSLGDSVAVNGVCLTVAELPTLGRARFYLSPETLARTSFGTLAETQIPVHLERAMSAQGRFSGHWVQGHVDGLARWLGATESGGAWQARFAIPTSLLKYCVEKGSIALDGVSLTINRIHANGDIDITLIPHTWELTHFSRLQPGAAVNVEVDVLAKYVENLIGRAPTEGLA
jgi:riboflavin synthase